jgi:hypothetical protein
LWNTETCKYGMDISMSFVKALIHLRKSKYAEMQAQSDELFIIASSAS